MIAAGVDLIELARMEKSLQNPRFLTHVFSQEEQKLFEKKRFSVQTIAANFAAKEAFSKALGTGVRGFSLKEVSVLRDPLGAPYFVFYGSAAQKVKEAKLRFSVSLTHTDAYAAAFVVAFK